MKEALKPFKSEKNEPFYATMREEYKKMKEDIKWLEGFIEETKKEYAEVAETYGEDPKAMQPEEFFSLVNIFNEVFEKGKKDIENQKLKEERAKQKEEENRIKEEKKKNAAHTKDKLEPKAGDDDNVMENAIAQLRGGKALNAKRTVRMANRTGKKTDINSMASDLISAALFTPPEADTK